MPLFNKAQGMSLVALATFYLPHVIFLFYKIGQSLFSPATKLYLYDSVCHDRHDELAALLSSQSNQRMINNRTNFTTVLVDNNATITTAPAPQINCQNLSGEAENIVQQSAANYIMAMKILQDIPAFLLGMCCGGWMDRIGERLPMMLSCLGGTVVALLFTFIQAFGGGMAIVGIFIGITINSLAGRNTLITMAIQAYVADRTLEKERTRQLGFILAMNFFGLFSGSLLMALMADFSPFWAMFLCVAFFYSICFFLILFALPDKKVPAAKTAPSIGANNTSLPVIPGNNNHRRRQKIFANCCPLLTFCRIKKAPPPNNQTAPVEGGVVVTNEAPEKEMNFVRKLFQCCRLENFTDTVKTLTRKRSDNMRLYLLLTYLCIVLQNMCKAGEIDVLLLFVKHTPLNWSKAWYAYMLSSQYATVAIMLLCLLPFLLKTLRLSDSSIIIWCTVAKTFGLTLMAFSNRSWMVFVASIFISTFGMIISCLRSIVSKIVDESEIGKCFAIISASETVSDLVGVILFIRLYHIGLSFGDVGRSLPFLVIAFIHLILLGITVFIKFGMEKSMKRGPTNNSSQPNCDTANNSSVPGRSNFNLEPPATSSTSSVTNGDIDAKKFTTVITTCSPA